MAEGAGAKAIDTLIKFTMSKECAEAIKTRFTEMGISGESVSYLDCVIFDSALEVLGLEQAYYGMTDEEWETLQNERKKTEQQYKHIKTIDITDVWKEVLV